jgi:hypothetical protein
VRSGATNVGVQGTNEVSGGLLGFSTTSAPPAEVLRQAEEELLARFRGNDDKYWGWRTPVAPMFRPAPIVSNVTSVTNLSPNGDGSVPTAAPAASGPPAAGGRSVPPLIQSTLAPRGIVAPRSVPLSRGYRGSNLDAWYFNLQGQGSGSVSPFAENAYSGLVGSLPAALIWSSFHGGTSGISVWQKLQLKVWSPVVHIHMEGDWDRVQQHFSGAGHAGGLFWSADIQASFNDLRLSGAIEVTVEVDSTLPNADKIQEEMNKRSDLVFQKFMDEAQKVIFDPAPFNETPAQASGGFLGFGGGAAFKVRRDQTHLHLSYDEHREMAYLQPYPISGQLEGLYDEIKADPKAEKKYFTTLYLADWERKVSRTVKPVVNWPDPGHQWVGEPVSFLSVQVGYPNTEGVLEWDGHVFQGSDGPAAFWSTAIEMKNAADVANAPSGWTPDKTFVKRQIHFTEPPTASENPFVRIAVEKNVVDLDPGSSGSLVDDLNLEVRVDSVGILAVGPMFLNVDLESDKQVVEVTLKALGQTDDGHGRDPVTFRWQYADQAEPRYWMIYTGQPSFVPKFQYQVRVIVKGSIFTKGMEWVSSWQDGSANGPLTISVPTPDDTGVTKKSLVPGAVVAPPSPTAYPPPHVLSGHTPPPPVVSGKRGMPPAVLGDSGGSGSSGDIDGWTTIPPGRSQPPASLATPAAAKGANGSSGFSGFSSQLT